VVMPFNGSSGSGDVTAEVVYANYGRLEDFDQLAAQHIDLRGKIVLVRYGANFRGVKVYIAEERGAAGVLLYSDPQDDGYSKGDAYPIGPWRPETGVQRGSVQYLFKYPGDPETPGVASTLELPDSARVSPYGNQPRIISIPISYHDAAPILQALKGPGVPQGWQGALASAITSGLAGAGQRKGPPRLRAGLSAPHHLGRDRQNQRHGVPRRLGGRRQSPRRLGLRRRRSLQRHRGHARSGPRRRRAAPAGLATQADYVFASWDAEEEGLIGSTEWVEQNAPALERAVAYFNTDVAVAGPDFTASAVPSLKQFLRELTRAVPSPLGGTVYQQWRSATRPDQSERPKRASPGLATPDNAPSEAGEEVMSATSAPAPTSRPSSSTRASPPPTSAPKAPTASITRSSTTTPGTPRTPTRSFVYLQEMARVFGLEALRMADADVLPYDYVAYARAIRSYIEAAKRKAGDATLFARWAQAAAKPRQRSTLTAAQAAAARFSAAAEQSPTALQICSRPPATSPGSTRPCARPKPRCSPCWPACPIAPGTGTPSTLPASTPATGRWWSFPASTRPSTPTTFDGPRRAAVDGARPGARPRCRADAVGELDVPPNRITAILNGQRGITGDTALRLAHFFGTSAQFWLNLQSISTSCASPSKRRVKQSSCFPG
jgi:N-acetylated-alpha-linked acidic dipeptidase